MENRKIKKSYISCTGYFFSYKNNTQIAFESTLERDFYLSLEFDSNVISYKEQPKTIQYEYPDKGKRRYTPDTLVNYSDGRQILFEVKYKDELESKELKTKLEILSKYIKKEYGLEFNVFTDQDISEQYLENIRFLYKFAFLPDNKQISSSIEKVINDSCSISIIEIINKIEVNKLKQLNIVPYIWNHLFLNNDLTNLDKKLTMSTKLYKRINDE